MDTFSHASSSLFSLVFNGIQNSHDFFHQAQLLTWLASEVGVDINDFQVEALFNHPDQLLVQVLALFFIGLVDVAGGGVLSAVFGFGEPEVFWKMAESFELFPIDGGPGMG